MSLVHEALQKAEREKQRKAGILPTSAPATLSATVTAPVAPTPRPAASAPMPARPVTPMPTAPAKSPVTLMAVAIAVVSVVAIVAIVYVTNRGAAPANATSTPPSASGSAVKVEALPSVTPPLSSASTTEPQPTVPLPPSLFPTEYRLSGIMKDPEGKFCAVLNGRMVYETQYVDGATVRRIQRDRVVLEVRGQEQVLRLF